MTITQRARRRRPIIRVFVSSTFSDLKLERDALQESVFPRLERRCQSQGFQFQAIDLRWGVPAEAALDHRTMRICFEELRRSQQTSPEPNFLILLGDRYGWRPIPELILEHDFEQLQQHASNADEQNVLRSWYRRDFNSIAPVYELRARTDSPDGQDYTHVKDADGRLTVDANGNTQDTSAWRDVFRARERFTSDRHCVGATEGGGRVGTDSSAKR